MAESQSTLALEVDQALQSVLSSVTFARSERARELLRYLVEQEQAGRGDRLKAFSIAQDVFGRGDDFDAQSDAVVRVQAGRLRDLLASYYSDEGSQQPLRIAIPVGSYVPNYQRNEQLSQSAPDSPAGDPSLILSPPPAPMANTGDVPVSKFVRRNIAWFWVLLGAIFFLLLSILVLIWMQFSSSDNQNSASSAVSIAAEDIDPFSLPVVNLIDMAVPEDTTTDEYITLRRDLARFSLLRLSAPTAPDENADYDFFITRGGQGAVSVEVVSRFTGQTIWADVIALEGVERTGDSTAAMLTLLAAADGLLFNHAFEQGRGGALMNCLSKTQNFFRSASTDTFNDAFDCLNQLIAAHGPNPYALADKASLIVEGVGRSYDIGDLGLEDAIALAEEAVNLAPSSSHVRRAYASALSRSGETERALATMEAAYELNPGDLNIAASYGFSLYRAKEFEKAAAVLGRATSLTDRALPWWNYHLFLSAAAIGDDELAIRAANQLPIASQANYLAVAMIAAQMAGDERRLALTLQTKAENSRLTLRMPPDYFSRRVPKETTQRFMRLLSVAGYFRQS